MSNSDRPILPTLSALFVMVAAGQCVSAAPGIGALAKALVIESAAAAPPPAPSLKAVPTRQAEGADIPDDEGIVIVDEREVAPRSSADATGAPMVLTATMMEGPSPYERAMGKADTRTTAASSAPVAAQKEASAETRAVLTEVSASAKPAVARSASKSSRALPMMDTERLAAIYGQMPAAKAAMVLAALNPSEGAAVISMMSGEASAAVLAEMPADAAVAITREILQR